MRFEFIAKHRGIWLVSRTCEALGLSRSGFHTWLVRGPSVRVRSDEEFGARVRASFISSYRIYGAQRVWPDLLIARSADPPPTLEASALGEIVMSAKIKVRSPFPITAATQFRTSEPVRIIVNLIHDMPRLNFWTASPAISDSFVDIKSLLRQPRCFDLAVEPLIIHLRLIFL